MEKAAKRKPQYRVIITVEASRLDTVKQKAVDVFGASAVLNVRKAELASSRADRLDQVAQDVQNAAQDVDELKDELQEWYDNLPEQFQGGDKGQELEEAIEQLEEIKDALEGVDFTSVSFPQMY